MWHDACGLHGFHGCACVDSGVVVLDIRSRVGLCHDPVGSEQMEGQRMAYGQCRRNKRWCDRANHTGAAIAFVLAIQQKQYSMGRGACMTQLVDDAISECQQISHGSKIGCKLCNDIQ